MIGLTETHGEAYQLVESMKEAMPRCLMLHHGRHVDEDTRRLSIAICFAKHVPKLDDHVAKQNISCSDQGTTEAHIIISVETCFAEGFAEASSSRSASPQLHQRHLLRRIIQLPELRQNKRRRPAWQAAVGQQPAGGCRGTAMRGRHQAAGCEPKAQT